MEAGPLDKGSARKEILRGVYEDNLRTVQMVASQRRLRRVYAIRKAQFPITLFVLILLVTIAGLMYPSISIRNDGRAAWANSDSIFPLEGEDHFFRGAGVVDNVVALSVLDHADPAIPVPDASSNELLQRTDFQLANLFDLKIRTIVIDPGHGGIDGGAVGHLGIKEKDITLDVAQRLRRRLEQLPGIRVLMTREGDTRISLRDRVAFANERQADLFISIHVNYLPEEPLSVIETYYFGVEADAVTLQLVDKENAGSDYTIADFNEMIKKLGSTVKLQESKQMAISIQRSLYRNMRKINQSVSSWGVKTAPFVVLLGVESPSVLAEIACLSNRAEEAKLNTSEHRERLAQFLEEGILNYLKQRPTTYETGEVAAQHGTEENQDTRKYSVYRD